MIIIRSELVDSVMAARVSSTSATAATAGGSTLASRNTEAAAVASSIMGDGKS